MEKLIEALQIFLKYGNPEYPTYLKEMTLAVDISPIIVSEKDKLKLKELGFFEDIFYDCFESYKYASINE